MHHSESATVLPLPASEVDQSEVDQSEVDQLEVLLQAHLSGRITNLRLNVDDGGIILRGHARTFHAKQLAQHAFMRLSKLPILANDIEVF